MLLVSSSAKYVPCNLDERGFKEVMRMWLIDAGYLFNAQRTVAPNYQFDYMKLRRKLEEYGDFWRGYYLNSTPNPLADESDGFHTWLRTAMPTGPKLITKLYQLKRMTVNTAYCKDCRRKVDLTCPHGARHRLENQQQKGVDVGLATLAMKHAKRYDTLVLSSGDGDLIDAIEHLSENGKRIELAVFKNGVSTQLQARADAIHWLDEFADEIRR